MTPVLSLVTLTASRVPPPRLAPPESALRTLARLTLVGKTPFAFGRFASSIVIPASGPAA